MKHVEEFLSTILRDSDDPSLADKLQRVIDALRQGDDLSKVARKVGLDPAIAGGLMESLTKDVLSLSPASKPSVARRKPSSTIKKIVAFSDGASRGNPGNAACAAILFDAGGEELLRRSKLLGVTTNNVAEYEGVILAMELASQLGAPALELKLDSELVVKQLNGQYKVRNATLKPLFERARLLTSSFQKASIIHVPRSETTEADKLANEALDGKES